MIGLVKPGLVRLFFGLALLAAGIVVSYVYEQVFWFGAILVGVFYVGQGSLMIYRAARYGG